MFRQRSAAAAQHLGQYSQYRSAPAACGQTRALGLSGTRELLAPGDRPYILLINKTWSVLPLRRRYPHQRSSQSGSSNYSDLGAYILYMAIR